MIIRPANIQDVERLYAFSDYIPAGMTSMPKDRQTWESKMTIADKCFAEDLDEESSRIFFLVLEDDDSEIMGTAGIHTQIGIKRPFYNYKVSTQVAASESLNITMSCETLNLVNDFTGATELTSLFVAPQARRKPIGQLLSRCRYLIMHDFPEYFGDMVFAEIRGWLNEHETSPFWEHIGMKFFNMPFKKADFISAVNGSQFISDLMPRYPIYTNLLSEEVLSVIGKPHDDAVPAQRLLEREGFGYRGYCDVFDAGPVMQCERDKIQSVSDAFNVEVADVRRLTEDEEGVFTYIVSNRDKQNYRISYSLAIVDDAGKVVIDVGIAERLNLQQGDTISLLQLRGSNS